MLIALSSGELGELLLEILESAPLSAQTKNRFPPKQKNRPLVASLWV